MRELGRLDEAADDARRTLAVAREVGYPAGEVLALADLSLTASYVGEDDTAMQLARQAGQIPADIPGHMARSCDLVLAAAPT